MTRAVQVAEPPADRGYLRRAALAVGLFALVVTGVHAGADRADDALFELVSALDRAADGALSRLIPALFAVIGAAPESAEAWTYRALDLVDVDAKLALARLLALVLEALVGLALAVPLVDPRAPRASRVVIGRALRTLVSDPTLLLIAAPIAVGAASLAGALVVVVELETVARALGDPLAMGPGSEILAARAVALSGGALVLSVLGARGVGRALARADALSTADRARLRSRARRRLRGVFTALIAAPLAVVAAAEALPAIARLLAPWVSP